MGIAVGTAAEKTTKTKSRYAWYVLFVLTGMYMLSFVDRQILSSPGPVNQERSSCQ